MYVSQWTPTAGLRGHAPAADTIPKDRKFFASPPLEIGTLRSAWSTLGDHAREPVDLSRIGFTALAGALGSAVVFLIMGFAIGDWSRVSIIAAGMAGAGCAFWLWPRLAPEHVCTFVGDRGLALFSRCGRRTRGIQLSMIPNAQHFVPVVSKILGIEVLTPVGVDEGERSVGSADIGGDVVDWLLADLIES